MRYATRKKQSSLMMITVLKVCSDAPGNSDNDGLEIMDPLLNIMLVVKHPQD